MLFVIENKTVMLIFTVAFVGTLINIIKETRHLPNFVFNTQVAYLIINICLQYF